MWGYYDRAEDDVWTTIDRTWGGCLASWEYTGWEAAI